MQKRDSKVSRETEECRERDSRCAGPSTPVRTRAAAGCPNGLGLSKTRGERHAGTKHWNVWRGMGEPKRD